MVELSFPPPEVFRVFKYIVTTRTAVTHRITLTDKKAHDSALYTLGKCLCLRSYYNRVPDELVFSVYLVGASGVRDGSSKY
jgi:hypothetical protein